MWCVHELLGSNCNEMLQEECLATASFSFHMQHDWPATAARESTVKVLQDPVANACLVRRQRYVCEKLR